MSNERFKRRIAVLVEDRDRLTAENERLREALAKAQSISERDPSNYETVVDALVEIGDVCREALGEDQ